jgi:hypothetical protein
VVIQIKPNSQGEMKCLDIEMEVEDVVPVNGIKRKVLEDKDLVVTKHPRA